MDKVVDNKNHCIHETKNYELSIENLLREKGILTRAEMKILFENSPNLKANPLKFGLI